MANDKIQKKKWVAQSRGKKVWRREEGREGEGQGGREANKSEFLSITCKSLKSNKQTKKHDRRTE